MSELSAKILLTADLASYHNHSPNPQENIVDACLTHIVVWCALCDDGARNDEKGNYASSYFASSFFQGIPLTGFIVADI